VIPLFGRLKQEDLEFEVSLGYIVSKKKKRKEKEPSDSKEITEEYQRVTRSTRK
jgi:hypothetical protein